MPPDQIGSPGLRLSLSFDEANRDDAKTLVKHLAPLVGRGVTVSGRHLVEAGTEFDPQEWRQVRVVVLLLSADYYSQVWPEDRDALSRLRPQVVLGILVSHCSDAAKEDFESVGVRLAQRNSAIHDSGSGEQAKLWAQVADEIERALYRPLKVSSARAPVEDEKQKRDLITRVSVMDSPALECDRRVPWDSLVTICAEPRNSLVLVTGDLGQAHGYFKQRIERCLKAQAGGRAVDLQMIPIDWPGLSGGFPSAEAAYRESLAQAFHDSSGSLEEKLASYGRERPLLILHPTVNRNLDKEADNPALCLYYSEWLPDLLRRIPDLQPVICIQPVAWTRVGGARRALARWFARLLSKELAYRLALAADASPAVRWESLVRTKKRSDWQFYALELSDIADADILHFLEYRIKIGGLHDKNTQSRLIKQIKLHARQRAAERSREATSEDIIDGLCDYLATEQRPRS